MKMNGIQYAGLVAAVAGGCYFGSFAANRQPIDAAAQVRQTRPNVESIEYLNIPNAGLRMINEQGRVVGLITGQGGTGSLFLMSGGQPSLTLAAGNEARINLGVGPGGSGLQVESRSGAMAQAVVKGQDSFLTAGRNSRSLIQIQGNGKPSILIPNTAGKDVIKLESMAAGPQITLSKNGTKALVNIRATTEGRIEATTPSGDATLHLGPKVGLVLGKDGKRIWQAPPKAEPVIPPFVL
jgi:hypothetical protein